MNWDNYDKFIIANRWWIIFFTLLIVFVSFLGTNNLKFDPNYRTFFGEDNPQLNAFKLLGNTYTKDDNVLFIIAPRDGNIYTNKTLSTYVDIQPFYVIHY